MSLDCTGLKNGKKKEVFYRGSLLSGFENYSSEDMLKIFNKYEKLLKEQKFAEVREIESKNNYPRIWLTSVISDLIMQNGNGLIKVLCDEFKDRGFADEEYYLNKFKKKED